MKKKLLFTFVFLLAVLPQGYSHPHIFITPAVTVQQSGDTITGFYMVWTWNRMWSYRILQHCDLNEDGIFSPEETELIYRDYFMDMKDFDFFTKISINDEKVKIEEALNFRASSTKEQIVNFIFYLPVQFPIQDSAEINIIFNDTGFSIAFTGDLPVRTYGQNKISNLKTEIISPFGLQTEFTLGGSSNPAD